MNRRHGTWVLGMLLGGLALAALQFRAAAELMGPAIVPLDRLLPNLEKYVADHPADAMGWFRLGRAHAIAFVKNNSQIHEPMALEHYTSRYGLKDTDALKPAERRQHLVAALKNFAKAIELDEKNPLFYLGRGYLLEQAIAEPGALPPGVPAKPLTADETAQWETVIAQLNAADEADRTKALKALEAQPAAVAAVLLAHVDDEQPQIRTPVRALLGSLFREAAIADLWRAYALSLEKDMQVKRKGVMELMDVASYQAGRLYLTLIETRPLSTEEKERVAKVKASIEHFDNLPQGPISPIVFSLTAPKPLAGLLDPQATARFDLDGDGVAERRPWLQPDTAILCWDPAGEGKITSGRQLFGNVTWWIFWNNGYEALDALDDNRDGELTGAELTGLAVWIDANQNGVSDPGEVEPVVNAGIAAISCRAPDTESAAGSACPSNRHGLRRTDGQSLPTYDWYAPAAAPAQSR